MSRRDRVARVEQLDERMRGFAARGYMDGHFQDFRSAVELQWKYEDRRREARQRRIAAALAMPLWVWAVAAVAVMLAAAWAWSWAVSHPILTVLGMVAGAALVAWPRRGRGPRVIHPDPVAPPDVRRHVTLDPLSMVLPADARAVGDAVDAGRRRLYLDALKRGILPAPSRTRDRGRDVVTIPLPGGQITPDDVRLDRFAATLGIAPGRVRRGPDRPGLLVVDVLDVAPAELPVPAWPALGQRTDWTDPLPFGVDEVGEPVAFPVAGRRWLVAGMSGSGKTRLMRTIALHAAGDPTVRLHLVDCKGSPALRCLSDRAAYFHAGPTTPEVVEHLQSVREDMHDRYARGVSDDDPWIVVLIDEAQNLWRVKGAEQVVEDIARMGREARIGLVIGSQTPAQTSIPTTIAGEADVRVALRLAQSWAPGLVLGDFKLDCSSLPAGHAYVNDTTSGRGPVRVAAHDVDDDDAATHLRGLPALPAGMTVLVPGRDEDDRDDLLDGVLEVIGERSGAAWAELTARLGPDVQERLRERGVRSNPVRPGGGGDPVRGVRRRDVEALRGA